MEHRLGSYEILSLLGRGGMGVVHLARDEAGRDVALKILHHEFSDDAPMRRRFEREARIALAIEHPNVVRALNAGEIEGQLFLASELVRGGTLAALLNRIGPLSQGHALGFLHDLVSGLDAIRQAGLIHRDLKPHNLLVESDIHTARVKLADFGLARPTAADRSRYTRTSTFVGTANYVAPEQIKSEDGRELDIRCDLYSAGVILYQCLSGHAPFRHKNQLRILDDHLHAPVPDVGVDAEDVDEGVAQLATDLLQKAPDDRPSTPGEVLRRIERLQHDNLACRDDSSLAPFLGVAMQEVSEDDRASVRVLTVTTRFELTDVLTVVDNDDAS